VSTGGPQALTEVIPYLPANLAVPVVIVQHMPSTFTGALAASLNDKSVVTVVEGQNGQTLEAGMVYIASGGKQMKIVQQSQRQAPSLLTTDDPPENYCKPSVDYLFRSVTHLYANRALGVFMTGMGSDGVRGLRLMTQQGAKILAQDAESCVVCGMPMEAIKAGVVDAVVPLGQLAAAIIQYIGRRGVV
jgi:two-component system chemotaxis response regulator CheB